MLYDLKIKNIAGTEVSMSDYKNKVLLIVNTASKCGFTPQYEGLETLHKEYKDKGLVVMGLPCNQFGAQEPGDENEIKNFCSLTYNVTFPMFAKVDVNGDNAHPLYKYLKKTAPGIFGTEGIKWNFTKFLINQKGEVIKRYAPTDKPESIAKDIADLLK